VAGSPYAITPSAALGTGLSNYTIAYFNGQMTVTPAVLTITANNQAKTYGNTFAFAGTEFTDSGLVNGDTVSSVTLSSPGAAPTAIVAGSPYAITPIAAIGTGLSNYSLTYVNGQITVNPATLTITANNIAKTYGTIYSFAGTEFTGAGLVNGDTISSVTLTSAGATATAAVAGNPYAITPSGALGIGLGNYRIVYDDGVLSVIPVSRLPPLSTLPGPVIAAVSGADQGTDTAATASNGEPDGGLGLRTLHNTSSAKSPIDPCIALAAQDTLPNQMNVEMMDIIKISPALAETLPFYKTQTQSMPPTFPARIPPSPININGIVRDVFAPTRQSFIRIRLTFAYHETWSPATDELQPRRSQFCRSRSRKFCKAGGHADSRRRDPAT
jgi:hypothetical protein